MNKQERNRWFGYAAVASMAMSALVASAEVKGVSYLRFWVFKARSANSSYFQYLDFHQGNRVGDFRLVKNGVELDWPSGTVCKYDKIQGFVQYGNPELESTTAVLDKNDGTSAKDPEGKFTIGTYVNYTPNQQMCYTICLPEGQSIDFDQYAVYRGYDTMQYHTSPRDWRMEVSANGTDWFPIDEVRSYAGEDWTCYGWYGVTPTPYYLSNLGCALDLADGTATLSSGSVSYAGITNAVSARLLRLSVTNVVAGTRFHVREFNVGLGGVRCARAAGAEATSEVAGVSALFDGDTTTGWDVTRDLSAEGALVAEIDLGEVKTFDGYDFCVAGSETVSGDATPNAWTLEAQDPDTGMRHLIASENAESVSNRLSSLNKCAWRSDFDGFDSYTVKGKMFHLTTAGLPAGLVRTAAGFDGVAFSNETTTSVSFKDASVGFAAGTTLGGTVELANAVLRGLPGDALATANLSGSGLISYAGGVEATLPELSPFDHYALGGDDGILTPASSFTILPDRDIKFLRFRVFKIGAATYSTVTNGTGMELSELEVLDANGNKVFWPAGTKAYCSNEARTAVPGLINGTEKFPGEGVTYSNPPQPADDRTQNRLADGWTEAEAAVHYNPTVFARTQASWTLPSVEAVAEGPAFIIELGGPVDFTTYRLFSVYNCIGLTKCPIKFTLDVSYDGENWFSIDDNEYDVVTNPWPSVNVDHLLFYEKNIDWSTPLPPYVDRIADDCVANLNSGVTMTLDHAAETVGGVSGFGKIVLSGEASALVIKNSASATWFAGTVEGEGTLVVDGGRVAFSDADLMGLTKIVVRNGGVLHGTAQLAKDVQIVTESGGEVRLNRGLMVIFK